MIVVVVLVLVLVVLVMLVVLVVVMIVAMNATLTAITFATCGVDRVVTPHSLQKPLMHHNDCCVRVAERRQHSSRHSVTRTFCVNLTEVPGERVKTIQTSG